MIRREVGVHIEVSAPQRLVKAAAVHACVGDETVESRQRAEQLDKLIAPEGVGNLLQRLTPRSYLRVPVLPLVEVQITNPRWIVSGRKLCNCLVKHFGRQNVIEHEVRKWLGRGVLEAQVVHFIAAIDRTR